MQIVSPPRPSARVGFVVPRWTVDPVFECQGIPFRALSVAGALLNAGYEIVWFDQEPDLDRANRLDELATALAGAQALFLWMNELDPLTQTQNATRIAQWAKGWHPHVPTVLGGEFVAASPANVFSLAPPFEPEFFTLATRDELLASHPDAAADIEPLVRPVGQEP